MQIISPCCAVTFLTVIVNTCSCDDGWKCANAMFVANIFLVIMLLSLFLIFNPSSSGECILKVTKTAYLFKGIRCLLYFALL